MDTVGIKIIAVHCLQIQCRQKLFSCRPYTISARSLANTTYFSEHPASSGAYTSFFSFNPSSAAFFCCTGSPQNSRIESNNAPSVAALTPTPVNRQTAITQVPANAAANVFRPCGCHPDRMACFHFCPLPEIVL